MKKKLSMLNQYLLVACTATMLIYVAYDWFQTLEVRYLVGSLFMARAVYLSVQIAKYDDTQESEK